MSHIPLVDLKAQHREISEEVQRGWASVLENTAFILGPAVAEFERDFARFSEVGHCVGVANGTDALELMLRAVGIGAGDEVLVPANTFIATALAVARAGGTPVLVDVDPRYQLMDVEQAARRISRRARALLPVHLFGQIAPMEALAALAKDRNLLLLEDAAQSQGARRNGTGSGGFGLAAATSFYPGKNLGAYGDGGAFLTNAPELTAKVRALRNYGSEVKYEHPELGFNSRLDTLQAVVLSAKLRRLAAWNEARRQAARRYEELLKDLPITLPETLPGNEHVWHLYVVRVPDKRDEVLRKLNVAGVGAGIHYPVPIHLQGAFRSLGHQPGDFPVAEAAAREILSLPLFPQITAEQQERVAEELRKAL
jgi:dTDP-4-amino-4,6-dideoxygalactose transaminase